MLPTALKTLLFTLVAPGTVTLLLPYLILRWTDGLSIAFGWTTIAGGLLILCGTAIYAACAIGFVRFGRGTPAPIDPPTELVVQGLYRWSRNPMYVGIVTVLLGESLLPRSVPLLFYAAAVFVGFNLFIMLYEEPTLTRMFGSSYKSYRSRVPRWIGPVRRTAQ